MIRENRIKADRVQKLNYHHLRYFMTVAREGSIAAASMQLGLSQPTISEQLRELESALGKRLFLREGRGLKLTETGKTVLKSSEQIFAIGNEMVELVKGAKEESVRPLRIGVAKGVSVRLVEKIFSGMLEKAAIPRELKSLANQDLDTALRSRELDAIIRDVPGHGRNQYSTVLAKYSIGWTGAGVKSARGAIAGKLHIVTRSRRESDRIEVLLGRKSSSRGRTR